MFFIYENRFAIDRDAIEGSFSARKVWRGPRRTSFPFPFAFRPFKIINFQMVYIIFAYVSISFRMLQGDDWRVARRPFKVACFRQERHGPGPPPPLSLLFLFLISFYNFLFSC